MQRTLALLVLAATLTACSDPSGPSPVPRSPSLAQASAAPVYNVTAVKGDVVSTLARNGIKPKHVFKSFPAFAAELSPNQISALRAEGATVRESNIVSADRATPSWGIDRIDQVDLPLDNSYNPPNEGLGATLYSLDTGVNCEHTELIGRCSWGPDYTGEGLNDCHGHGTHTSGTMAGLTVGVSNQARVVAVKVLGCNGYGADYLIATAIDWVIANAQRPAVINMSLGTTYGFTAPSDDVMILATERAVASGITVTVSAGNNWTSACNVSPAAAPNAITFAASDRNDGIAGFSNWGPCVDMFAPGVDILSAWTYGGYTSMSGTSMAAPHGAGAAAQEYSRNPSASPASVRAALVANAVPNKILLYGDALTTPNLLLNVGSGGVVEPPPPPPPTTCPPGTTPRGNSGKCKTQRAQSSKGGFR